MLQEPKKFVYMQEEYHPQEFINGKHVFELKWEAQVHDTIWIWYDTDTSIQENFKIQDTIRLRHFNKKIKFKLHIKTQNTKYGLKL